MVFWFCHSIAVLVKFRLSCYDMIWYLHSLCPVPLLPLCSPSLLPHSCLRFAASGQDCSFLSTLVSLSLSLSLSLCLCLSIYISIYTSRYLYLLLLPFSFVMSQFRVCLEIYSNNVENVKTSFRIPISFFLLFLFLFLFLGWPFSKHIYLCFYFFLKKNRKKNNKLYALWSVKNK